MSGQISVMAQDDYYKFATIVAVMPAGISQPFASAEPSGV